MQPCEMEARGGEAGQKLDGRWKVCVWWWCVGGLEPQEGNEEKRGNNETIK